MPGRLTLLRGPGGAGKSQRTRELLDTGEVDVQADLTPMWAALKGIERGPDGRYPTRLNGDPALPLAQYIKMVAVRDALRRRLRVLATTSRGGPRELERWRVLAVDAGAEFADEVIDPGIEVVTARLSDPVTGRISPDCQDLLDRWYNYDAES